MIPKRIFIHHSLTEDGVTVSWGAIRHFHMTDPKHMYRAIGYHAGAELMRSGDRIHYEVLMGRMWHEQGAHAEGQNIDSLGFCFVGNYDIVSPLERLLFEGARFIAAYWCKALKIPPEQIFPHSKFSTKSCPGKLFPMDHFRSLIKSLI